MRAQAAGRQRPGLSGDVRRCNETAVAARRRWTSEESLAAMYRARAELRLVLWQAQAAPREADPVVATNGGKAGLPGICTILSEHDREQAAELRDAGM